MKDAKQHPAGEIAWSDVFNVIRDVPGIRKVAEFSLNNRWSDVLLGVEEFPTLGKITISNGDIGSMPNA